MIKNVITILSIFIISQSLIASENLFNVSTINLYNLNNQKIVSFDYDYNKIAELFVYDIPSGTKRFIPMYGSESPSFLLSGFNGKEIVYVNFNTTYKYYIDYYNIETSVSKRIVGDGSYKEFIWCSEDKMVWIDYRNLGGSSTNSEVYMYDLRSSIETRITNDTYYQSKSVTNGKYIVWVEYTNLKYGNIVIYDIETGQRKFIDQINHHQDNPKIYGNFIVWQDYRNTDIDKNNADIYLYDIANNKTRAISSVDGFQSNPYIYQNMVVWEEYKTGNTDSDINSYNLNTNEYLTITSKQVFESSPQVDKNIIVYAKIENNIASFIKENKYFTNVFVEQPSNSVQCEGSQTVFKVKISDDIRLKEKELNWYKGQEKLVENAKYLGVNDTILTINNVDVSDSGSYYLKVTLKDENVLFNSDYAVLNVKQSPIIISQPDDTIIARFGEQMALEVSVSGTQPFEYQWYKNDTMLIGYNNELLLIESFARKDTGEYYCRIINECNTTFSNKYQIKLDADGQPPLIVTQPNAHYIVHIGDDLTISVEAIGTPDLKYEWYKNNLLLLDDTTNIYHKSNIINDDGSSYYCRVSNNFGYEFSDTATVDIITGVDSPNLTNNIVLSQNEPNPFIDNTIIIFQLANASFVKLAIYDIFGNEKAILVNKTVEPGLNRLLLNSSEIGLSPGVYFYSLSTKDFFIVKKMMIAN